MSEIKIIPLGGVREDGKCLFVVEVSDSIFVLDCGLLFPEDELLGIDAVIPDFSYLEENADRVVGIFLTHGHADAVGALPYLLEVVDAPVFGTELTIELASISAKQRGLEDKLENFFKIDEDTEIEFDDATVSFFRTTHTIPDSVGISVNTPQGAIVYTGDFKFDPSAKPLYQTNFGRLTDIGEQGVLALLSDSNDAETALSPASEEETIEYITDIFRNAIGRVVVACFGSNIARVQQIFEAAHRSQRKIYIPGGELLDIVDTAIKLDKIIIPSKDIFGQIKQMNRADDNKIVVLETGIKGDPIKALQLMAKGRHQVKLREGDTVFFGSSPRISMETTVAYTKDTIYRAGATVTEITGVKTSGHATPNDLMMMMSFLKPTYFIPVNGEYRNMLAHAKLASAMGIPSENIILPAPGDVIEISKNSATMTQKVVAGDVLIDGNGVGDVGSVVLRDRKILSEDGIFVVVATISRRLKKVLVGPQITSKGFIYVKTNFDLIEACSDMTLDILENHLERDDFDWGELKSDLRDQISKYLYKETKRRPVVLPMIMEASSYQRNDKN